jgi:hypothetical protein
MAHRGATRRRTRGRSARRVAAAIASDSE